VTQAARGRAADRRPLTPVGRLGAAWPRPGHRHISNDVVTGVHTDFLCSPVQARIIHECVKGSVLVQFEKSGHFPWLEQPRMFFSTVTDFLGRREAVR
jgi:pimeloyl-ACP methyl ester carboxylesterase